MTEASPEASVTEEKVDYESTPLTRPEYISAIVHLYRGELYRANSWRIRLDMTTNWAVLTTAGILSFAFGEGKHSHLTLLAGIALTTVFWVFEARRYRFADIWYSRVRKIEENFYGPILRRDPVSPEREWGRLVARDLFQPRFKIGRLEALRARFLRNYWAIYLVLLLAWGSKVLMDPVLVNSWEELKRRLGPGEGTAGWWLPFAAIGVVLLGLGVLFAITRPDDADPLQADEKDHWN